MVSTDHCPFCLKDQKELGLGDFSQDPQRHRRRRAPHGPACTRASSTGEITLERWVETCSHHAGADVRPVPGKGVIAPGADADIVVYDPNGHTTIGVDDKHHMNMDHSAWEGFEIDGKSTPCSRAARSSSTTTSTSGARATAGSSSAACPSTCS